MIVCVQGQSQTVRLCGEGANDLHEGEATCALEKRIDWFARCSGSNEICLQGLGANFFEKLE